MWEENGEGEGLRNADENNLTHHFLEEVSSDQELVKGSEEQSLLPALRVFLGTVVGITLGIWGGGEESSLQHELCSLPSCLEGSKH